VQLTFEVKRIGVTGASGFIGTALVGALLDRGDFVRAFVRNPNTARLPSGAEVRQLDLTSDTNTANASKMLEGLDAVVHLAGESVSGRWTAQKKKQIHDSRQLTTRRLVAAMRACSQPPRTLVSASASGYYGSRRDAPLTEESSPGGDFLARVCVDWEFEANKAGERGVRVVCMRQGLVLASGGGALGAMLPPFKFGAGGPLGSGAQWWPWIHITDNVALYLLAIDREDIAGAVNAVSPDIATNARFSQALGHALRRPSLAFAPSPALKIVLGEFAATLMASQLILPAKAEDSGFVWRHESLDHALLDLLDPDSGRDPGTVRFESSEKIRAGPLEAFDFFSSPANLQALAPPELQFHLITPLPIEMRRGAIIEYTLKMRGLPVRWKTLITKWRPGVSFTDVQLRGPYSLWRHDHDFEPSTDGVVVRDTIDYALPLAPLSNLALPMVRSVMRRIFDYRGMQLSRLLLPKMER
jgi:uncharacterized protein